MKRNRVLAVVVLLWAAAAGARAQTLDKEMPALAASLNKELVTQGSKNVAATDFTDLQGQPTELGRFLAEQLSVEMVLARGIAVLDRANFKSILAEHKLTEEGLVNPANAKKLGEFAGVDTILTGSVTLLDAAVILTVKAISTESSRILAAGKITFQKTADLQWIANRSVSGGSSSGASGGSPATAGANGSAYSEPGAIAMKDLGALRIALKSVLPIVSSNSRGRSQRSLRVSLDFTSRETQNSVIVAANAEPGTAILDSRRSVNEVLRTSLVDDRGGSWSLPARALSGIASVRAGVYGPRSAFGWTEHSAQDIARLLALRDQLGREIDDPSDGYGQRSGSRPGSSDWVSYGNQFVSGSFTAIAPGQTIRVVMDFMAAGENNNDPGSIQLSSELVVGTVAPGGKKSYSLQTLMFDQVALPAAKTTTPR